MYVHSDMHTCVFLQSFASSGFAYGHDFRRVVKLKCTRSKFASGVVVGHTSPRWTLPQSAAVLDACTQVTLVSGGLLLCTVDPFQSMLTALPSCFIDIYIYIYII
jgi:hypothetical protein